MHMRYQIYLRPEPEGGFTVIVPALPGCITWGKNLAEAKKMAIDAIKGYLHSLKKHGDTIPQDNETLLTAVEI
ncbi:MAG: type II toxin-antitoxin system HicB family antitoxin [Planctomycetota bacterium]